MTPSELGDVLRAGSNLCYRMESLPNLYYLSFQHMEFTAYEMDPKLLSLFVLDFLRSIYCYGSWIEEYDNIKRLNIKKLILQKIEEEETEKAMLKAGIVLSSGQQQQQQQQKKKEKEKEKEEEEEQQQQQQQQQEQECYRRPGLGVESQGRGEKRCHKRATHRLSRSRSR